jgi:hypothetical protein
VSYSYAGPYSFACNNCGQGMATELWMIMDTAERPDLVERIPGQHDSRYYLLPLRSAMAAERSIAHLPAGRPGAPSSVVSMSSPIASIANIACTVSRSYAATRAALSGNPETWRRAGGVRRRSLASAINRARSSAVAAVPWSSST